MLTGTTSPTSVHSPIISFVLAGPLWKSWAPPFNHRLPRASTVQVGARGCPERCGHQVGRDQGTGRGFGVQRGDPGCVAGVQSGCGPELGSGECPGAGLWLTKSECGRWARSGQGPPENRLRVSCSPSPHPVQGQWDRRGQWGRRAPHRWADVLWAEEGRTPSTWVSSGCCRRRMSTLGAERVWSTERLYAWQTAVCPLPGAKVQASCPSQPHMGSLRV